MDVNDNSSIHCSSYTRQWVASVRSRMASRLGMTLSPPPVIVPSPPQLPRGWTRQRPKTPPPPPNPEYDYANIDKELRALVDLEYVRWEEDKKRREKFPNGEKGSRSLLFYAKQYYGDSLKIDPESPPPPSSSDKTPAQRS
ncbi:Chaperone protein HtpG [Folsomia candida]|uniref:Chaperone protein HtpG n=1 Tax=Folsomia candida TaxID=158441 RepID=A0A226DK33_FOLCA|nr:Chaperone protein HtpG [Folsomia candida]